LSIAFVDRPPTEAELERFRLILSTYQDGSGMLAIKAGRTLPGWRDFERSVAAAFGGVNQENKAIFDVLIPDSDDSSVEYGISCKMRSELRRVDRDGRVTIELSNSSKKFNDYLLSKGISRREFRKRPEQVGAALIELIETWKRSVGLENGGRIILDKSCYLSLLYDRNAGIYQLFWFSASLPLPQTMRWYYSNSKKSSKTSAGHLNGDDAMGRLFEWYGESGGQIKYYPLATDAKWISPQFQLEPIPDEKRIMALPAKAIAYFPEKWGALH
jgi:hypothetical protein